MPQDKYTAVWVSHSSMGDFLKCPRAYFLHNVYKDPKTGHKINIVSPATALGIAVHETLEPLHNLPVDKRFTRDLLADFTEVWKKVQGSLGGFRSEEEEESAKERGRAMVQRVIDHPGPIAQKAVRLPAGHNNMPPNFYLSEEDNIILCGLVDWLEYREEDDSVRIIDFKTGRYEEGEDSLQLPIYLLLLTALQKRIVSGAAYWYLDRDDEMVKKTLPPYEEAFAKVLVTARSVKEARESRAFNCPKGEGGCFACRPYEAILKGEAEYVGVGGYKQDLYMLS
ncbi:MAG: PD-(D/E)XK nuclease family protein [Candidatus Pacebacteria bacterium]|nr:PD-(D/E)XK nuclease family protein [Candidatus Paceibacterota bacterium]